MLLAPLLIGLEPPVVAAVIDVTATDVTTRRASMVWASDEPATDATVRVFADAAGTTELTGTLSVTLASQTPALDRGIIKVEVSGLAANTCVYFETETTGSSTVTFPSSPPFIEVCTAVETAKVNPSAQPITNDLIRHDTFEPDGVTPAAGALILLSVPGVGANPLTAFVGEGFAAPAAVVDLNNLFASATGTSAELIGDEVLQITEFRGLDCPGLTAHKLLRYRRAPDHEESPAITELEAPDPCFFADMVCDDTVNILDVQRVLNLFNRVIGECEFNDDLDVVDDDVINVLDVQAVLNRFGESAPFSP